MTPKTFTLRDMIQSQRDEVASRTILCRDCREEAVRELEGIEGSAVVIAALLAETSEAELTRMLGVPETPEIARVVEWVILHERWIWTHYTITHDEFENDHDIAFLNLSRVENAFTLTIHYMSAEARIWWEEVSLTQDQAAQYMRDTRWSEDWTDDDISFYTETLNWNPKAAGNRFRWNLK